ncbi:MHC class I-related chain-like precursor [Monodelphis domestica]|uniref:MHC class I-related chain-like n=1 Tax=Monodelphis domestica TaxID=13616 RepID=D7URV4_MONDO|nr:MHC class I-related chain-like precursor [Monodelphis domestica]BAJ11489.1 MHC class I-related chain-like [Monodelphis domestica]
MEGRATQQAPLSIVLRLLLLLLLETWTETQAWPASLRYDLTVLSQAEEPRQPLYVALGYINDQLFLHYDGENENSRAERQKPWNDTEEGRKVWERVTQGLEEKGKELRMILQDILGQNNQSDSRDGSHTLQATLGCELQGNDSTRGFWRFRFDGQDFITFSPEKLSWISVHPGAQKIKEKWEDWFQMKLQEEEYCSIRLQRYLATWKGILERTDLPTDVPPRPNTLSDWHPPVELLIISIGLIFAVLIIVGAQVWRWIRAEPEIRPSRNSEWKSAHPLFPGFGRIRETQSMV